MKHILFILSSLLFFSCNFKSAKIIRSGNKRILKHIENDPTFQKQFTGISAYSISEHKEIVNYNANKNFTPASNTKILTFFAAHSLFPDTLISFYYKFQKDTCFILPNADPSFLHPDFPQPHIYNFFNKDSIHFVIIKPEPNRYFGSGWAWDDYADYYQAEITDFPIHGNSLFIKKENSTLLISPKLFQDSINFSTKQAFGFKRDLRRNKFYLQKNKITEKRKQYPFVTSDSLTINLLSSFFGNNFSINKNPIDTSNFLPFYGVKKDTILKKFMDESDNFIGEQLIQIIGKTYNIQKTSTILDTIKKSIFKFPNKDSRWVDGSGLSRYNLFSPRFFTSLLTQIYEKIGSTQVKYYFPGGGKKGGSLEKYYVSKSGEPFVYAKTGTLSNNHNLSGFIFTDKGNILAFSIMNNHFLGSSSSVKPSIEKVLLLLKNNF